jgi:hypothetical protein
MEAAWGVCEIINADGLPIRILPVRLDAPLELAQGERVRWLVAMPIGAVAARRIARARSRMVAEWVGRETPAWLQTYCPLPPGDYCRPVRRIRPDGQIECFPSIAAAARAIGRDRMVVKKRVVNCCIDCAGCRWEAIGGPTPHNRETERRSTANREGIRSKPF